jgi:hypothetical protein
MKFLDIVSTFVGHFCPPGSGSGSTDPIKIRIRISITFAQKSISSAVVNTVICPVQSQELATLSGAGEEGEPCPEEGLSVGGEECFKLKA